MKWFGFIKWSPCHIINIKALTKTIIWQTNYQKIAITFVQYCSRCCQLVIVEFIRLGRNIKKRYIKISNMKPQPIALSIRVIWYLAAEMHKYLFKSLVCCICIAAFKYERLTQIDRAMNESMLFSGPTLLYSF